MVNTRSLRIPQPQLPVHAPTDSRNFPRCIHDTPLPNTHFCCYPNYLCPVAGRTRVGQQGIQCAPTTPTTPEAPTPCKPTRAPPWGRRQCAERCTCRICHNSAHVGFNAEQLHARTTPCGKSRVVHRTDAADHTYPETCPVAFLRAACGARHSGNDICQISSMLPTNQVHAKTDSTVSDTRRYGVDIAALLKFIRRCRVFICATPRWTCSPVMQQRSTTHAVRFLRVCCALAI